MPVSTTRLSHTVRARLDSYKTALAGVRQFGLGQGGFANYGAYALGKQLVGDISAGGKRRSFSPFFKRQQKGFLPFLFICYNGSMGPIIHFEEIDSTNNYLKTNCASLRHGTIVTADRQTAGRGRFNRKWESQEGGLYFSVLIKPQHTDFWPNFTQLMGLSLCRAIEKLYPHTCLKWPNDVLADGKKLCGILSEGVLSGGRLEGMVIGTGINVGQKSLPDVGQPATSLYMLGIQADKQALMQDVMNYFWQDYPSVEERGFAAICEPYRERFPFRGKKITVKNGEKPLFGTVQDVSSRGTLVLATESGPEEIYIGDLIV